MIKKRRFGSEKNVESKSHIDADIQAMIDKASAPKDKALTKQLASQKHWENFATNGRGYLPEHRYEDGTVTPIYEKITTATLLASRLAKMNGDNIAANDLELKDSDFRNLGLNDRITTVAQAVATSDLASYFAQSTEEDSSALWAMQEFEASAMSFGVIYNPQNAADVIEALQFRSYFRNGSKNYFANLISTKKMDSKSLDEVYAVKKAARESGRPIESVADLTAALRFRDSILNSRDQAPHLIFQEKHNIVNYENLLFDLRKFTQNESLESSILGNHKNPKDFLIKATLPNYSTLLFKDKKYN